MLNLRRYFSILKKALLLFLIRQGGRLELFALCCSQEPKAIHNLVGGYKNCRMLPIDGAGSCPTAGPLEAVLYYSNLQFVGIVEPRSGKSGLHLLPDTVVYNGMKENFLSSFTHFREQVSLHVYTAIHMQHEATLSVLDRRMSVGGRGHVTVIKARNFDREGRDFEVSQFGPGEEFLFVKGGLQAAEKSRPDRKSPSP